MDLGCESAENWQLPSTSTIAIVIITQPVGWYSFHRPTEGTMRWDGHAIKPRWQHINWTVLNKSTQLYEALVGHAHSSASRPTSQWLVNDIATKLGRLVLSTCVPTGLFNRENGNPSSSRNVVHFGSCAMNGPLEYCGSWHRTVAAHSCRLYAKTPGTTAKYMGIAVRESNSHATIQYDPRCYFNVRSKADISQLNLPHGNDK